LSGAVTPSAAHQAIADDTIAQARAAMGELLDLFETALPDSHHRLAPFAMNALLNLRRIELNAEESKAGNPTVHPWRRL
jgi:hypothetical protein